MVLGFFEWGFSVCVGVEFVLVFFFFSLSCKSVVVCQGRCSKEWSQVRGAVCVELASQTDRCGLNLPY